MTEETKGTDPQQSAPPPEMVEISLDNRQVKVPKDVVDVLKNREHELGSRNDRLLAEGRQKLENEKNKQVADLTQDLVNLDKIIASGATDLSKYNPLVKGGDGKFYGNIPKPSEDDEYTPPPQNPVQNVRTNAFDDSSSRKLLERIDNLEKKLNNYEEIEVRSVINVADKISPRFPGSEAYLDAVITIDMKRFHETNGRPPSVDEIEKMFTARHNKVVAATKQQTSQMNVPDTRGGVTSSPPNRKAPRLDDTESMISFMHESAGTD
jgi:hypothetical protein